MLTVLRHVVRGAPEYPLAAGVETSMRRRSISWSILAIAGVGLVALAWAGIHFPGERRLRRELERLRVAGEPMSAGDLAAPVGDARYDAASWYELAGASRSVWKGDELADPGRFEALLERARRGEFDADARRALDDLARVAERLRSVGAAETVARDRAGTVEHGSEWIVLWNGVASVLSCTAPPASIGADELVALRAQVAGSGSALACARKAGGYRPITGRELLERLDSRGHAAFPRIVDGLDTTRELTPAVLAALWSGDEASAVLTLAAGFEVAHLHRDPCALTLEVVGGVHWNAALDALERALPLLSPAADVARIAEILDDAAPRRGLLEALRVERIFHLQVIEGVRGGARGALGEWTFDNPGVRLISRWLNGYDGASLLEYDARVLRAAELPDARRVHIPRADDSAFLNAAHSLIESSAVTA